MTKEASIIEQTLTVDLLDRRKCAKNFLEVVLSQNANVYSINAPWGAGKTHFLKFIEEECKLQKIPFAYFNVWETDYIDSPFISISSELIMLIEEMIDDLPNKNELIDEVNLVKKHTEKIISFFQRFSGAISYNMSDPSCPSNSLGLNVQVKPIEKKAIDSYIELKKIKSDLRELLLKLTSICPDNKIIIAIDELDRCRPDYAITTLEIIKHFFNVDNIIFLLAVDKEQIQTTVKTMFGTTTDSDAYLKKFVDIEYYLSTPKILAILNYLFKEKYSNIYSSITSLKGQKIEFDDGVPYEAKQSFDELLETTCNFLKNFNFTPRDLEKLALKLSIILPVIKAKELPLSIEFLICLIQLSTNFPKTYEKIKGIEFLGESNNLEGKSYYLNSDFTKLYRMITAELKSTSSSGRNHFRMLFSQNLIKYFDIIDFVEDFS